MTPDEQTQYKLQHIVDVSTRARLRAEVWARAYSIELTGLRANGDVRDHQDADAARAVARCIADAAASDFDAYCRERLP
jgi:hypothetical protein